MGAGWIRMRSKGSLTRRISRRWLRTSLVGPPRRLPLSRKKQPSGFNKYPDAKECDRRFNVQVAWDHEAIEPLSRSIIDLIIDDSATRMIKVFQCPSEKSNTELKESFCIDGPGDGYDEVISARGKKEK